MPETRMAALAALARLNHVSRRGQELADAIDAWAATDPITVDVLVASDRLSWEGTWRVVEPPFEQWALVLGDAVHHLRAMLDNALHSIAEREGATKQQLGAVQFPIVTDPKKWSGSRGRIEMLPERVRRAIVSVQPFQRPEAERQTDALAILGALNNADKHRIILLGLMEPRTLGYKYSVEFEDGGATYGPPKTEFFGEVADGSPAVKHDTSPDRIANVKGEGEYRAQVVVLDDAGNRWGMTSILASIGTNVSEVLDLVFAAWAAGSAGEV